MKVFISFSGDYSRRIAELLREWLPSVLQYVDPFLSSRDTDKGSAWFTEIASQLSASDFGLICLTPDNMKSEWIHFEAGAIANKFGMRRTGTLLVDVNDSDLRPPLSLFQHTQPTLDDMLKLLTTINKAAGDDGVDAPVVERALKKWWPDFEDGLSIARKEGGDSDAVPPRETREILEEILELVRGMSRRAPSYPDVRLSELLQALNSPAHLEKGWEATLPPLLKLWTAKADYNEAASEYNETRSAQKDRDRLASRTKRSVLSSLREKGHSHVAEALSRCRVTVQRDNSVHITAKSHEDLTTLAASEPLLSDEYASVLGADTTIVFISTD